MKKMILLAVLVSSPLLAETRDERLDQYDNHDHTHKVDNSDGLKHEDPAGVPELDKSATASAAVLLVGGLFLLFSKRKT